MGGGGSKPVAQNCVYNKRDFNRRIDIVKNAHEIVQFYASQLLREKMPVQLEEYKTYNEEAEKYFNTRRKEEIQSFIEINPKVKNFYDFYNALQNMQYEYEKTDITENERRAKITSVFNLAHLVLKLLIEELWESCDNMR